MALRLNQYILYGNWKICTFGYFKWSNVHVHCNQDTANGEKQQPRKTKYTCKCK